MNTIQFELKIYFCYVIAETGVAYMSMSFFFTKLKVLKLLSVFLSCVTTRAI